MQPGYCSRCYRWLGALPGLEAVISPGLNKSERTRQSWLTQVLGNLLAAPIYPLLQNEKRSPKGFHGIGLS